MSENINNGGSAFPVIPPTEMCGDRTFNASGYPYPEAGMSLRDWFAGQALAGWLASFGPDDGDPVAMGVARLAFELADAMLKARGEG